MNDNQAKTLSTVAIWIATAVIFVFGVFRMQWDGVLAGMFWMVISLVLAIAPAVATQAIWSRASSKDDSNGSPKE